jgi:serine/threonine protein kinase
MEDYNLIKILGQGAFGTVYLVEKNGINYVMKKIKIKDKFHLIDIVLEVEALKKLSKYNNCSQQNVHNMSSLCLIESFIDLNKTEYVIVTNYLDNAITLATLLEKYKQSNKKLSLENITFIMARLISQLDKLHKYNIIHNDIKPQNIIIQYKDNEITNVLFIDFGLSCIKLCKAGGTITYMAPELFKIIGTTHQQAMVIKETLLKNEKTKDEGKTIPINKSDYMKTDVFSLGIVFYEMLHNHYPYPSKQDYIRTQKKFYKEHPLDFELDVLDLKQKNIKLFNELSDISEDSTEKDKDNYETTLEDKIDLYLDKTTPSSFLDSPFSFYKYYKTNPQFTSSYTENESNDPQIANIINDTILKMLIVNPLQRPSIHRIKSQFDKIINKLLDQDFFKSEQRKTQLISPIKTKFNS